MHVISTDKGTKAQRVNFATTEVVKCSEQGLESFNLSLEFMLLITIFVKFKSHKLDIVREGNV